MSIGQEIKRIRNIKNMSVNALANIANVPQSSLRLYEMDKREAPISSIVKIAQALEVNPLELVRDEFGLSESEIKAELADGRASHKLQEQPRPQEQTRVTIEDLPAKALVPILCERIKKEAPLMDEKTRERLQDDLAECQSYLEDTKIIDQTA